MVEKYRYTLLQIHTDTFFTHQICRNLWSQHDGDIFLQILKDNSWSNSGCYNVRDHFRASRISSVTPFIDGEQDGSVIAGKEHSHIRSIVDDGKEGGWKVDGRCLLRGELTGHHLATIGKLSSIVTYVHVYTSMQE